MSVFEKAKDRVTLPEAARRYGYEPNRSGFIRCPFHNETAASMKLYQNSFHCFGCGAHGSVIDFVARLFNLEPLEAVKRLNDDFCLGLQLSQGVTIPTERELQRQKVQEARVLFTEWRERVLDDLAACIRTAHLADINRLSDGEALAIRFKEAMEEWFSVLLGNNLADQMKIFRDREGVARLCSRILKTMPEKSSAS